MHKWHHMNTCHDSAETKFTFKKKENYIINAKLERVNGFHW